MKKRGQDDKKRTGEKEREEDKKGKRDSEGEEEKSGEGEKEEREIRGYNDRADGNRRGGEKLEMRLRGKW